MDILLSNSSLIACIGEGGAEHTILNILLDNGRLIFNRGQLIDETILRRISVKDFEKKYLRRDYDQKITIIRVIDSRSEKFKLSKAYSCQVEIVNVITTPEIEILIIIGEGKYNEYTKNKTMKPSTYCKTILKLKYVKSPDFIRNYFSNPDRLIRCITEYQHLHKSKNKEATLYDLIKK